MLLQAGLPFRQLLLLSLVSGVLGLGRSPGGGVGLGPVPSSLGVWGHCRGLPLCGLVDMVRGGGAETKGSGQVWRRESQPLGPSHWEPPEGWQGGGWGLPAHQHLRSRSAEELAQGSGEGAGREAGGLF